MTTTAPIYTIPVEAVTREHAISLACVRYNQLYDDGMVSGARQLDDGTWEVAFVVTGGYVGPYERLED